MGIAQAPEHDQVLTKRAEKLLAANGAHIHGDPAVKSVEKACVGELSGAARAVSPIALPQSPASQRSAQTTLAACGMPPHGQSAPTRVGLDS